MVDLGCRLLLNFGVGAPRAIQVVLKAINLVRGLVELLERLAHAWIQVLLPLNIVVLGVQAWLLLLWRRGGRRFGLPQLRAAHCRPIHCNSLATTVAVGVRCRASVFL